MRTMKRRPAHRPSELAAPVALLAAALLCPSPPAHAEGGDVEVEVGRKGLEVRTADGRFAVGVGGRLHADASFAAEDDAGTTDGTELRRARLKVDGTVYEHFDWVGEVDFADNETAVKDFALSFGGFENTSLSVGHQKQPYSLAVEMSSNDTPFIERGIDTDAIISVIDRAIGVRVDRWGSHWFAAAGFYGDGVSPEPNDNDDGYGFAGRLVGAPVIEDDRVVHVGFRGAWRAPSSDTLEIRNETTHLSNQRVFDIDLTDIDHVALLGPELAVACGPWSLFGEYNFSRLDLGGGDASFHGAHVSAHVSLTGESRAGAYRIRSGEFKRLTPERNLDLSGGFGAVELAVRWAWVDLEDGPVAGGNEHALNVGLNWYLNPNVRLLADYGRVLATSGGANADLEGLDTISLRTQFTF